MEWGRMGCGLSKIKSNRTYIVVFDFISDEKGKRRLDLVSNRRFNYDISH